MCLSILPVHLVFHMPLDVTYETICVNLAVVQQGVVTMKAGKHSLSQFYQFDILAHMSVFFFSLIKATYLTHL